MSGQLVHWLWGSFVYLWSNPCGQQRGRVGQRPLLPDLGVVGGGCAEGKAEELNLTGVTAAELRRCLHLCVRADLGHHLINPRPQRLQRDTPSHPGGLSIWLSAPTPPGAARPVSGQF